MSLLFRHTGISRSMGFVAALAFFAAHGCGGDVSTEGSQTSGAGATGGGGSTTSATTGSTSSASSASAGGSGDCENVPEYIANLQAAATECAPGDPTLHCQDIVDGFCCPVVVESIQSPATQAYLDFLELTKQQCPALWEQCALVDCAFPEPGHCVPDNSQAGGHCSSRL